jgi:phosphatidylserine/phosphatidylglycerophosphate/cardiolipin synthase-like enzyme/membrane protein DedA with SNARE-associated domain
VSAFIEPHPPIATVSERQAQRLLIEGRNCWRIARADRVAFLVDAAAYFAAFAATVERAKRSILIIGWDIDSREPLFRDDRPRELPTTLAAFLDAVVRRRRGLHAYVLSWDFAFIYLFEREAFPVIKLGRRTHHRLHFRLDGAHPFGASQHQKIVVVDDAVAFVGGIDLAKNRWDTPEHLAHDPRRVTPDGVHYAPFHDVQVMLDGEAAAALGDLARERWRRATGHRLRPLRKPKGESNRESWGDPWPSDIKPDLDEVEVAIARTEPAHNGYPEVCEVEHLHLDAIAAARHWIYIENQYLTSHVIGEALSARLQELRGLEVVVAVPQKNEGWLEENTMGVLRARLLRRLHGADRYGRLRVYCPIVPDLAESKCVNLHSKVLIIDDTLVRVGSSNMSNRSMGFDTECDVAIEAAGEERIAARIADVRHRLLGEHLDVLPERVAAKLKQTGSLIKTIESLRGRPRTLQELDSEVPAWVDELVPDRAILDPERSAPPDKLFKEFIANDIRTSVKHPIVKWSLISALLLGIAAAWQWTPLGDWLDVETLSRWEASLQATPFAPLLVIAVYVLAGLLVAPVTVLIVATALAFEPLTAFAYAMLGCLASAAVTYGLGRWLSRDIIRRLAGGRVERLSQRLAQRGLVTVLTLRLVPLAPFTITNLVAGASRLRFRDFILGTLLGMMPGILAIAVFEERLEDVIREPGALNLAVLLGLAILIVIVAALIRRWLRKEERDSHPGQASG